MIVKPKRILWPTDFSVLSLRAGHYAAGFRAAFGSGLHVIHVIPPPLSPDVAMLVPSEVPVSLAEPDVVAGCRKSLERLIREHLAGDRAIEYDAFFGNPWSGICEYARKQGIDLIVISTHGRTGVSHVLIGSTAERVVQHAPCPVLTVKDPEQGFLQA